MPDDYDGEQDEPEDDEVQETDLAAFLSTSGEDPEADDALAGALQLDAVAMVAWQRFSGKGKGKSKGKGKVKCKGKNKGSNLSLEQRKKRLAELKSRTNCQACGARGHWAGDDIRVCAHVGEKLAGQETDTGVHPMNAGQLDESNEDDEDATTPTIQPEAEARF